MEDQEIERYKSQLLEMRARLIASVQEMERSIHESIRSPGDISNLPTHPATEDAEGVAEHITLARNEQGLLEEVEAALRRIESGDYGRCAECGREVLRDRLDALPFASHCIDCARRRERDSPVEP